MSEFTSEHTKRGRLVDPRVDQPQCYGVEKPELLERVELPLVFVPEVLEVLEVPLLPWTPLPFSDG